jgi:urocanate hydratase
MNSSQVIGQQLCQALGIDSQHVTRLMLICDAQESARVFIDALVPDAATGAIAHAARGYELHQLGAEPPEPTEEW